jgi:hypothetical protein
MKAWIFLTEYEHIIININDRYAYREMLSAQGVS